MTVLVTLRKRARGHLRTLLYSMNVEARCTWPREHPRTNSKMRVGPAASRTEDRDL